MFIFFYTYDWRNNVDEPVGQEGCDAQEDNVGQQVGPKQFI